MPGAFSSKRHFLFDLDGTLVDSTAAHARAFVEALQPKHPVLARDFDYAPFAGQPTREVFLALGFPEGPELAELIGRKQQLYREAVERGEVAVFAGVVPLLARLREKGRRLFLVTGASRVSTERVLLRTGLADYFNGITTAEDAAPGKPAPEPFLHTLATHGLEGRDCLVIEDGESGIRSAQSAGLDAVLIHTDLQWPGVTNIRNCEKLASLLFT
jgi:HAD superfamily hydrolase (TIGR01509 family)